MIYITEESFEGRRRGMESTYLFNKILENRKKTNPVEEPKLVEVVSPPLLQLLLESVKIILRSKGLEVEDWEILHVVNEIKKNQSKEDNERYSEIGRQFESDFKNGYLPAKVVNPFLSSEAEERLI